MSTTTKIKALPVLPENTRQEGKDAPNGLGQYPQTWASLPEAVRGNVLARQAIPLSYMELILTSNCNLRCSYCFERDKVPVDMTEQTAFAGVDFLIETSRHIKDLTILYFGGEPMMRLDLMEAVHDYATQAAQKAGKRIFWNMTTNGTLIDEEKAIWLARHGVKYLLSMDGGREDHDRYRHFPNGQGSFDLLAERIPMLQRYQPWMGVKMSISPEAAPRLTQNIKELSDLGIQQFIYGYAHGMEWTDEDLLAYEQAEKELCELYLEMKYNKRYFRITNFEEEAMCKEEVSGFGCGAGRGRFCVDPYGDIFGCSKLATIQGPGCGIAPIGNVFQGYTNPANREKCLDATDTHRVKCKQCEFHICCAGGCPATNQADTGEYYIPDDAACKLTMIGFRVNDYMRRRHDEVFGTDWTSRRKSPAKK